MSTLTQRRAPRHRPERSDTASVRLSSVDIPALIIDISELGCCLVLAGNVYEFELQQNVFIQLSRVGKVHSTIRWMAKVDGDLFKMGIEFTGA